MYCNSEVEILCKYYFGTDDKKKAAFVNEWNSFKFELISMRKKWFQLKENMSRNRLKPHWLLKQICGTNKINVCTIITCIAKVAYIILVCQ